MADRVFQCVAKLEISHLLVPIAVAKATHVYTSHDRLVRMNVNRRLERERLVLDFRFFDGFTAVDEEDSHDARAGRSHASLNSTFGHTPDGYQELQTAAPHHVVRRWLRVRALDAHRQ